MRLPIHLRLAGSLVVVAGAALAIGGAVMEKRVAGEVRREIAERVRQAARLLGAELAAHPIPEAESDAWADERGATIGARVTLIADDGHVLGDSDLPPAELATLENHAGRPEVASARATGMGESQRYSTTVRTDMLYVAVRLPRGVVRVSMPLDRVAQAVGVVRTSVGVAMLAALAAALLIALVVAGRLTRPIEDITRRALEMARGQFEGRLAPSRNDELGDLATAMNQVATDLGAQLTNVREEGARLRAVLDGMTEGVMVTDDEGRMVLWNESFGRLFPGIPPAGRRPIEVVRSAELQEAIHEAAREPAPLAREIALGDRTFIVRVSRIQREVGPSRRIVAVFHDVSELRRSERMRRDFVANASHELRTPIATVRAAVETILDSAASLPESVRNFSEMIHRQARRMSQLVDDMLRLSELESSYRPQAEAVDVAALAGEVVAAARARAQTRRLELFEELPEGLLALADPAALEQILTNLVDNAAKYTPDGGRVVVRARAEADKVVLEVADTGPGIPREHLARLFERFYRVDSGRAREHGGTGLGLAIVKHLALANRGEVSVTSEIGRGSTFTVRLPRARKT